MKKKFLYIGLPIAIIIIIALAIAYYFYSKPVKDFANSKAEITLSSKDLLSEFQKNEAEANTKYVSGDKTIQISGKILEIKKGDDGVITIILDAGIPDGDVSCALTKEEATKIDKYKQGMDIIIKGQCAGYQELINKEAIMIRCGIVD
jgi:hypothetical protein